MNSYDALSSPYAMFSLERATNNRIDPAVYAKAPSAQDLWFLAW